MAVRVGIKPFGLQSDTNHVDSSGVGSRKCRPTSVRKQLGLLIKDEKSRMVTVHDSWSHMGLLVYVDKDRRTGCNAFGLGWLAFVVRKPWYGHSLLGLEDIVAPRPQNVAGISLAGSN